MGVKDLIDRLENGPRPSGLAIRRFKSVSATVAEIREAIAANPGHPLAEIYRQSTDGMAETSTVYVEHADLLALATNRDVHQRQIMRDGSLVLFKEIGEPRDSAQPAKTTPEAPAQSSVPSTPGPDEIENFNQVPDRQ